MNTLGTKAEIPTPCEKPDEPYYPKLYLRDKAMDEFLNGQEVDVGDEFEVTLKVRVCGMTNDKHGQSLDMEVLESEDLSLEPKKSGKSGKSGKVVKETEEEYA